MNWNKFMKKITKIIVLVLCYVMLCGCKNLKMNRDSIVKLIEKETNVVIPSEFEIKEQYSSDIFMHGRLPNFFIFKTNAEPTSFLRNYDFTVNNSEIIEENITDTITKENEAYNLRIPKNSLIDFTKDYLLVYQKDNCYLVYYVDIHELIVYIVAQ